MKSTKPDLGTVFKLPNPGLRAYLSHVEEGQPEDYRPPFWKDLDRETVLDRWQDRLDSLREKLRVPGLYEYELEMRTKVGPMSVQLPLSQRIESIEHYYTLIHAKSVPVEPKAIELTWKHFSRSGGARLRSPEKTLAEMKLSTNSGAPYFARRRLVAAETLSEVKEAISQGVFRPEYLDGYTMAATLGWRGQEGGPDKDDVKQRVVWMMPFSVNLYEAMAYQPLVNAWQRNNINSAYISMRAVEEKITQFFDTKGDEYCIVTDFSKFDQHFNGDLQDCAKKLMERMLGYSNPYSWLEQDSDYTNAPAYSFEWMENVFPLKYNIPLLCSEDLMYYGHHGMASGSTGTNFDECLAHTALQFECAYLNGRTLNPYSNAYGDDGYLSFKGIDVDKVISAYSSHGQEMNPDKQSADKHSAVYLRRYFHDSHRDNQGIMLGCYSTFRALGRLLAQERYYSEDEVEDDYKSLVELRAYSILENCNNHPLFYEFVDFVMSGDRYRLGLDIPGFLDSLGEKVKKFNTEIPDLLGYTKTLQKDDMTGIENWKIVKYLKEKAKA